jgi:hypothetical protein
MDCLDAQIAKAYSAAEATEPQAPTSTFSGPPPAWVQWCDEVQMPNLAQQQGYQRQFQDRITELQPRLSNLERDIAGGRLGREPHAGLTRREIKWLMGLMEVAA